jgi:hypothetical protein
VDATKTTGMTQCMVRPCTSRGFRRSGALPSCINVSGLRLERFVLRPSWISTRVRSHYRIGLKRGHLGHQGSHAPGKTGPPYSPSRCTRNRTRESKYRATRLGRSTGPDTYTAPPVPSVKVLVILCRSARHRRDMLAVREADCLVTQPTEWLAEHPADRPCRPGRSGSGR